jgi:DCN1-like protein 3
MGQKGSKENSHQSNQVVDTSSSSLPHNEVSPNRTAVTTRPFPSPSANHHHTASPSSTSSSNNDKRHSEPAATDSNPLEKFFKKYKDESEDAILAAGMEQFCEDLGVDPTDFIVLIIAWKFQASEMCRFTREEFINGCQRLKVIDARSLKQKFPDMLNEIQNSQKSFKDLYNFSFSFGLDHSTGQRTLPVDMATALWKLLFAFNTPSLLPRWLTFVEGHAPYGISRDTWAMFLPFIQTIKPDLSNYDESEAWPSLFDDFVEMELQKNS